MSIDNDKLNPDAEAALRKESNDYDEILSKLELWTEELAARGPRAISVIQREMHDYLGKKIDEGLWASEPCIDFNHQKGYE